VRTFEREAEESLPDMALTVPSESTRSDVINDFWDELLLVRYGFAIHSDSRLWK